MESLKNFGVQVVHPKKMKGDPFTAIVIGMERSGTSMVANMLESLGVFMGSKRDLAVYEDVEISSLLESRPVDRKKLRALIRQRNDQHGSWGFKRPGAVNYIRRFESRFRNVHYIIPFRDLMVIANRHVISMNSDLLEKMRSVQKKYEQILEFVDSTKRPCFLFSYEKSLIKREAFVESLAAFLDIPLSGGRMQQALGAIKLDNPTYLLSSRTNGVRGSVSPVHDGILAGWAVQDASNDPVSLDIWVNGERVHTVIASAYREDLAQKNVGNGHHGFRLSLREKLMAGAKNTVRVTNTIDNMDLVNSPQSVMVERT